MRRALTAGVLVACAALAACRSPEATRTRGGGLGADVNNRPATARMHEGSQPYWKTPRRIDRKQQGPLDAAAQADRLSR